MHVFDMQCFQNAAAYLATAISYERKMFVESTPVVHRFPRGRQSRKHLPLQSVRPRERSVNARNPY
jgi:hypothetical protein